MSAGGTGTKGGECGPTVTQACCQENSSSSVTPDPSREPAFMVNFQNENNNLTSLL